MRLELVLTVLFMLIMAFTAAFTSKYAIAVNDTVGVNVTVTSVTSIDIMQTNMTFLNVAPGTGSNDTTIEVRNIGSTNASNMWAFVSTNVTETSNPLPTGSSSSYSAGGYLVLKNSTATNYSFVGRLEWNLSSAPTSFVVPTANNVSYGWFRNTSYFYMWNISSSTACNITGLKIHVSAIADEGTAATRNPSIANGTAYQWGAGTAPNSWVVYTFTAGGIWNNYCVAVNFDCIKIYIYKYDAVGAYLPGNSNCASANYLVTNNENELAPGDSTTFNMQMWVPYGAPAGGARAALLTIGAATG